MTTADARSLKSTIDRIPVRPVSARDSRARENADRRRTLSGVLTAILGWIRDPVGVGADLGGWSLDEEEIRAYCRAKMAPYKVPVAVEFVDEIPRSASGKALRRLLRSA